MKLSRNLISSGILFAYFLLSAGDSGITEVKVRIDGQEVDLEIPEFNSQQQNTTYTTNRTVTTDTTNRTVTTDTTNRTATTDTTNRTVTSNQTMNEDSDYDIQEDTEFVRSEIAKRLKRSSVMKYDRNGPPCFNRLKQMREGSNNKAIQFAVLVDKGKEAQMTCHFCQDKASAKFKPMNWFKLNRGQNGRFKFNEIGLAMHDKQVKNRLSKTVDHTLMIRKAKLKDAGSYFCHDFVKFDRLIAKTLNAKDIQFILSDTKKFRFIYHLDVMRPSSVEIKEVSLVHPKKPKPAKPEVLADHNLRLITEWQKWGPCSKCGKPGSRQRLGLCIVQKNKADTKCKPWFVESVMVSNPTGVPCRSTIFRRKVHANHRPDEILREKCMDKCAKKRKKKVQKKAQLAEVMFKKQRLGYTANSVRVIYGKELKMSCPGANLDTSVIWLFKGKALDAIKVANRTNDRITIDVHNVLSIKKLELTDSGQYICLMNKKDKVEIIIEVFMDNASELWEYSLYLLATYPITFMIFLSLLVVRHRRYKVGVVLTEDKKKLLESSSDSSDSDF